MFKKLLLTAASCFLILLFLKSEFYGNWFEQKVWAQKDQLDEQMEHTSMKERMEMRFGKQYMAMEGIMKILQENKAKDPLVLLPPNAYLKSINYDFNAPEPAIFYYFTGYKAVWTNSPNVQQANWALVVQNNNMNFIPIQNKQMLDQLLDTYKNFKPAL